MKTRELLFIQRRPTRAGAQTSLFRLASVSKNKAVVLCAEEGWLTAALPHSLIQKWPSARSLAGRIGGLKFSARKVLNKTQPALIIANDHQECPFALAIAREAQIPCLVILRTPGMSQRDFEKYQCADCDHLFVVGEELNIEVRQWSATETSLFQEGFLENEFASNPITSTAFPDEILVAGSSEPRKGFNDLIEALKIVESRLPEFPLKKVTLTGQALDTSIPDLRCDLDFVGRVDDFIDFARNFHFAVHPSRHETFGLAPLELIIAGIPTLCTETGCANAELLPDAWRTTPSSPEALANSLEDWVNNWETHQQNLGRVIETIHREFSIETTAAGFFGVVASLLSRV